MLATSPVFLPYAAKPGCGKFSAIMGIIIRYILKDLLQIFLVLVFGLTLFMAVLLIGQQAVRMNLGLGPTLRLIPFILPTALVFAVPGTVLFAACYVYGRMSADNEVVAVKAMGVSPLTLFAPGLVLAFVISLGAVWLNDVAYSWGQAGAERVVLQSVEEIAYGMLRTQRSYANGRFSIIVKEVIGRRLISPTMNFQPNNDLPAFTLTAREAELKSNLQFGTLSLVLLDCEMDAGNGVVGVWPGRTVQDIPLTFAASKDIALGNPVQVPLRRLGAEQIAQREQNELTAQTLAVDAGFTLAAGDFDALNEIEWSRKRNQLSSGEQRLRRLQLEPWRRWANGFSCLAFVMVGAPLAMRLRNSHFMTTFGFCFLPILIFYYPLLGLGIDQAKAGAAPPYLVWTANVVCFAIGVWLIRRELKH